MFMAPAGRSVYQRSLVVLRLVVNEVMLVDQACTIVSFTFRAAWYTL